MWVVMRSGLGDETAVTGLVREIRRAHPKEFLFVDIGRPELLLHNRHLAKQGTEQKLKTVTLSPLLLENEKMGNLVTSFCLQAGVKAIDTTPEVFLSLEEREKCPVPWMRYTKTVALDYWATWPSRQWDFERFQELTRRLNKNGIHTVELGKKVPDEAGRMPSRRLDAATCLFDQLSVRQTAAVLANCDLFVGNDSGLMHLAAAVGTPQVAIFSVKKWYARSYWNTLPVFPSRPCRQECAYHCVNLKANFCLNDVGVDDVERAVGLALERFPKDLDVYGQKMTR